jgi:hypothetical protein
MDAGTADCRKCLWEAVRVAGSAADGGRRITADGGRRITADDGYSSSTRRPRDVAFKPTER